MEIQRQFPGVHWIWGGGISYVYEIHPRIVVKVPQSGDFEREQFEKELKIYEIFSQNPPCPSIVQCFFYTDNGIFLEYMRDMSLSSRIQYNHIRDHNTMVVTKVNKLEPLSLRKRWMNDLAQAVAFLESLNLAHGDLRPENILLDRDRLKLSDFDCTAEIGTYYETCTAPYARILNSNETDQGPRGGFGYLGPRTEQFALGSLYYLINYGFEVYGDRCLTPDDPREHGPKTVDLLQNLEFPRLDGDSMIDSIIDMCWHNRYPTVALLASHTEELLNEGVHYGGTSAGVTGRSGILGHPTPELSCGLGESKLQHGTDNEAVKTDVVHSGQVIGDSRDDEDREHLAEDFSSKRALCQDVEKRGLLQLLISGEPEKLGFDLGWYRHASSS